MSRSCRNVTRSDGLHREEVEWDVERIDRDGAFHTEWEDAG